MDLQTAGAIVGLCSPVIAFLAVIFTAGKKAEQYAQLVSKVASIGDEVNKINDILLELQGTSGKASGFQRNLESNAAAINSLNNLVSDLRLKVSLLENAVQQQIRQWESLEGNVTTMLKNNSGSDATMRHLKESLDRAIISIENARERISALEARSETHKR